MKNETRITIEVSESGDTKFSIERDGVLKTGSFGNGSSSFSVGNGGSGCLGVSQSVRLLAMECRKEIRAMTELLELP